MGIRYGWLRLCGSLRRDKRLQVQTPRENSDPRWLDAIGKYLLPKVSVWLSPEDGLSQLGVDPTGQVAYVPQHRSNSRPEPIRMASLHQSFLIDHFLIECVVVFDSEAYPLQDY